jgi:hypothetical protein
MVLFLFYNVIYVFLLLWLCILIVCLCMTTLTEGFPCFFLSCKANTRVKSAKTGQARTLPNFCVFYVFFVLFYVFLCSIHCLFCDVLCIVRVYMCTKLLPPGGYPIAVKYISYHISHVFRFGRRRLTHLLLVTRLPQAPCQKRSALKQFFFFWAVISSDVSQKRPASIFRVNEL